MSGRLLEDDPVTGVRSTFHYDQDTGGFVIQARQEVDSILTDNHENYKDRDSSWKGDVHHVASIPSTIWAELKREGIADDEKALKRWLDDPDNRAFRTRPGHLS